MRGFAGGKERFMNNDNVIQVSFQQNFIKDESKPLPELKTGGGELIQLKVPANAAGKGMRPVKSFSKFVAGRQKGAQPEMSCEEAVSAYR